MEGLTVSYGVKVQDTAIGISFRRKDNLSEDVIWSVFEKWLRPIHDLTLLTHWL